MVAEIETRLMEEYRIVKISDGYYRTVGGRAYIQERARDYRIISCNGSEKGIAASFAAACVIASRV